MKKSINITCFLTVLLYLQACSSLANTNENQDVEVQKLIGHYIYGHEVNSFKPCNQMKVYWISGSEKTLQVLESKYTEYTIQPYEEVFINIKGQFVDRVQDGFAMDYDGQIEVQQLTEMQEKSESDCQ